MSPYHLPGLPDDAPDDPPRRPWSYWEKWMAREFNRQLGWRLRLRLWLCQWHEWMATWKK